MDLPPLPLPPTIRSRYVPNINGLRMHVLEAGWSNHRCLLLCHGFPEIAYSWRKVMPVLASQGYHVIAPDQRGYGRTTGWDSNYHADISSFRIVSIVQDALALVSAFGYKKVEAVIGHDFGASIAAWASLMRPDVFPAAVIMSAPFAGPPALPFGTVGEDLNPATMLPASKQPAFVKDLGKLAKPRVHYHYYYSTEQANKDMVNPPQGLHNFLRAYFHHKSGDWEQAPHRLEGGWAAESLATMPTYYIMEAGKTMPENCVMPSKEEIEKATWLTDDELATYSSEYARTGFQGGFNWYRCRTENRNEDLTLFSGLEYNSPLLFVGGDRDWGVWQSPGAVEAMEKLPGFRDRKMVKEAGHWVQQEAAEEVSAILLEFLEGLKKEKGKK